MVERAFSAKNAAYKSLISLLLLVPAVFALIILIKTEKAIGFDCTSCREDAYNGDVCTTSASPWSYNICVFKITCMITSFVLLLPFLFETVGMGLILADCLTEPHDTVPTIRFLDSNYLEYDLVNDKHNEMRGLFSSNLIRRSGYFFVATFLLLAAPIQHIIEEKSMSSIGRATKGYAGFLPDLVLTVILFPLSAYVILSSQTVAETLVNLVAVQIFAQLDDVLVRMVLQPAKSTGAILDIYCTSDTDSNKEIAPASNHF